MIKREAKFTILFRHWLKANPLHSAAFELKQSTKDSLPFAAVKDHQIEALRACKNKEMLYKIPDDSRGVKPFDMVYLRNSSAYVIIAFPKEFHLIDIEMFCHEKAMSKRQSLTNERAREIAFMSVQLKAKGDS